MLSISFDPEREWWVSGKVFDRLYDAAIAYGKMPSDLISWRYIADANGGLGLDLESPSDAHRFETALRDSAERELRTLERSTENETYRVSLEKLLDLLAHPKAE
ncbi:hypothetical protein FEK35_30840 [Nocardia cyriacigeorgica]|uniref:Uncharacterized protein n=1 Tax=Nocardia cyriacigeorgica TaxID=135487 RepID=A0A5R8P4J5_9NOCA|nr:hypothetical protein [Nocardia cyriacigeorgica]TLF92276.1 hypothetical protein FEK35_30840 [Nocardia cyriacigeorgica]